MQEWFKNKFEDDVSALKQKLDTSVYYEHHVHAFMKQFFTPAKVSGKKILDFGCGPGFYSAKLSKLGAIVTGIDLDEFLINKANEFKINNQLSNLNYVCGDFIKVSGGWAQNQFDFVIAIDTLVSFDFDTTVHKHDLVVSAMRQVQKLLKKGGGFLYY